MIISKQIFKKPINKQSLSKRNNFINKISNMNKSKPTVEDLTTIKNLLQLKISLKQEIYVKLVEHIESIQEIIQLN